MEIESIEVGLLPLALTIILVMAGITVGYAILQYIYRINSTGTLQTIGCQVIDDNGTLLTSIDWGSLEPNSTVDFHCFVINNGSVPITLNLTTENWNPVNASNYITLTWDYLGDTINPSESHPIILTLTVSPEISGISDFSFDIVITATEVS